MVDLASAIGPAVKPAVYPPSMYGNHPDKHFYQLPGMESVDVSKIFPTVTPAIFNEGQDLKVIEEATRKALENVDMSNIGPMDRVTITASEHGFGIMGGLPYLTMIRTIKDVIEERTHNYRCKVLCAMYRLPEEGYEIKRYYDLEDFMDCKVECTCPFDEGVRIDTELGTFYGNKKVYDCDHLIYAYYDDPREQYLHRGVNRLFKSFIMNFARVETRCSCHMLSSSWNMTVIPEAIYNSKFVQDKWGFACILNTSPMGIRSIKASNDLYECERDTEAHLVKDYTLVRLLFKNLQPWLAVWDGGKWGSYLHTAGMIYGCCASADVPFLDLDVPWAHTQERLTTEFDGKPGGLLSGLETTDSLKGVIMNECWTGLLMTSFSWVKPFYCVGQELLNNFKNDRMNQGSEPGKGFADGFKATLDTLEEAIDRAEGDTGCTNLIAFDGSYGVINCSPDAARDIVRASEGVEDEALRTLVPKYLKQRHLDPAVIYPQVYGLEYQG